MDKLKSDELNGIFNNMAKKGAQEWPLIKKIISSIQQL